MAVTNRGDLPSPAGRDTVRPAEPGASDEALMSRVQAGDEAALRILMDRHARPVLTMIRWLTGNRDWAESLAQDVFATVYLRAADFKSDRKFAPWLYSLARHAAIDCRRRLRSEREAALSMREPPGEPPPLEGIEARERAELAQKALDRLPEKFRLPVILCDIEGMSYEQAAPALGCSTKTLSTRLTRAREKLRRALERYVKS